LAAGSSIAILLPGILEPLSEPQRNSHRRELSGTDDRSRRLGLGSGFAVATGFLTRIPVPHPPGGLRLADAAWAFPLVGAGIGAVAALAFTLAQLCGLGAWPASVLALLGSLVLTGALHEDGLADSVDGLCGGGDREEKLAIMRDSRLGAFGGLALVLSVLLRAAALAQLGEALHAGLALIAAHAASRALLPMAMRLSAPARAEGLAAAVGRPGPAAAVGAVVIGAAIALAALGPAPGALALGLAAVAVAAVAVLARRQIGGYTGDILGACQQLAEIAILLVAARM
jgi:adenosylcobinamide-GDP ribazoletransferase